MFYPLHPEPDYMCKTCGRHEMTTKFYPYHPEPDNVQNLWSSRTDDQVFYPFHHEPDNMYKTCGRHELTTMFLTRFAPSPTECTNFVVVNSGDIQVFTHLTPEYVKMYTNLYIAPS